MTTAEQPVTSSTTLTVGKLPTFSITGDAAVIQAIISNRPFPAFSGGSAQIAAISLSATASPTVPLPEFNGIDNKPVAFEVSASAKSSLTEYTNSDTLSSDLGFTSSTGQPIAVTFPSSAGTRYLRFKCGYSVSASGSGQMALSPSVTLSFGAAGSSTGEFDLVRSVPMDTAAQDACQRLLTSWVTPGAIANGSPLPTGVWIIAQVGGQISANLGVQAGYNFNWVKQLALGGLDGDVGLKVAAALTTTLSAKLSGNFVIVLDRETDASGVRLRLFRDTYSQWSFALDASADVSTVDGILPDNAGDLIKAVFGIQDAQLVSFLSASLGGPNSTLGVADIGNLLGSEFLTRLSPGAAAQQGLTDLKNFVDKWSTLPQTITDKLWKYASLPGLSEIKQAATLLSNPSADAITAQLDVYLKDVSFFSGAVGEWLESSASETLFDLYERVKQPNGSFDEIRTIASQTLAVLDGDKLENVLSNLQSQVNTLLSVDTLKTALDNGNLSALAGWVQQRLAQFLGLNTPALNNGIARINSILAKLDTNANQIYAATLKALNHTYGVSLATAYTSSDSNAAMLDVEFAHDALDKMQKAIAGDFGDILMTPDPNIKINVATLTHGITRHTNVEMQLPWETTTTDDLVSATVTGKWVDSNNGRVQFYASGTGSDVESEMHNSMQRFSAINIGLAAIATCVRNYDAQSLDFGYSFVTAQPAMTVSQLSYLLTPPVTEYFDSVFGNGNGPSKPNLTGWIAALDKSTDAASPHPSSAQIVGPVWSRLQVSLRPVDKSDWLTPLLKQILQPDFYTMSRSLQTSLRKWLLAAYCNDPNQLNNGGSKNASSAAFLVYTALPAKNDLRVDDGEVDELSPGKGDIKWDYEDTSVVQAVIGAYAMPQLQRNVDAIGVMLSGIPSLKQNAQWFSGQAEDMLGMVSNENHSIGTNDPIMRFLRAEAQMIDAVQSAFVDLQKAGRQQFAAAIPLFTKALATLAQTFNATLLNMKWAAAQEVLRNFAPLVLQDVISGGMLRGYAQFTRPDAVLDVALLKSTTLPTYPAEPDTAGTSFRQRVTNFD